MGRLQRTVDQNVRDTQMTTRVTKGARLARPPSFPASRGFDARARVPPLTSTKSEEKERLLAVYLQRRLCERFRAEKRNEHAWTFLPRSPGRVWKSGGIWNILLPKNKMFPLIIWKEQAICLQKLKAVVITLSLLNFLEEYLIVKQTLTTSVSLRCTGNVHA